jgi:hypothetical protein
MHQQKSRVILPLLSGLEDGEDEQADLIHKWDL